jgi:hypothetical protein
MRFSTALKISGVCLVALGAELVLAYFIFSNYAFSLAETGQYAMREAYTTGPMGTLAKAFYGIFAITIAIGVGAPLISLLSMIFQRLPKGY